MAFGVSSPSSGHLRVVATPPGFIAARTYFIIDQLNALDAYDEATDRNENPKKLEVS
jgi:hypothetical protein